MLAAIRDGTLPALQQESSAPVSVRRSVIASTRFSQRRSAIASIRFSARRSVIASIRSCISSNLHPGDSKTQATTQQHGQDDFHGIKFRNQIANPGARGVDAYPMACMSARDIRSWANSSWWSTSWSWSSSSGHLHPGRPTAARETRNPAKPCTHKT